MAKRVKVFLSEAPLLLTELSSKPEPEKAYLLLSPIVWIVVALYLIANGQEHSFLIRVPESFII